MEDKLSIKEFCEKLDCDLLYDNNQAYIDLATPYVSRPGMQLTGYFEHFDNDRIQIIGRTESSYLENLPEHIRISRLRELFKRDIPCIMLTSGVLNHEDYIKAAKEESRILIASKYTTNKTINRAVRFLDDLFAPKKNLHGVLVEVTGVGILVRGESGVGKSEVALELIKRGHRLVADDLVSVKRISEEKLLGYCPEVLKHFMEIRGVGIIDIRALYGMGAIKEDVEIDVVVNLEKWKENKYYERLGIDEVKTNILGVNVTELILPVMPGRNMAVIIETVARNYRVTQMDYHPGEVFCEKVKLANEELYKNSDH